MRLSAVLFLFLVPFVVSSSLPASPQHIFSNPQEDDTLRVPTSYESAIMARRILHLTTLGTLSTIFPTSKSLENRPSGLHGMPIGLMGYIADCETTGNPTILAVDIATSFRNVAAGSNISLSIQWTPPYAPRLNPYHKPTPLPYSAANLPRFSLIGYLEKIDDDLVEKLRLIECFTHVHPDARLWLPGNAIHKTEWVRLVVQDVYWIGGFGDRNYIGWIPVEEWRNVTKEEYEGIRLPGENRSERFMLGTGTRFMITSVLNCKNISNQDIRRHSHVIGHSQSESFAKHYHLEHDFDDRLSSGAPYPSSMKPPIVIIMNAVVI